MKSRKRKKYILLFYIAILCFSCGMSQSQENNTNRNKAISVIEKADLNDNVNNKPYLLFSINDKLYHIVVKNKTVLEEYSIVVKDDNKVTSYSQGIIENPKNFLLESFNSDTYQKEYIDLNSKFYESGYEISNGNPTYFYFKDKNGKIYGESKLTTIINPNPLNTDMYNYMLGKALSIAEKK
jgi:uncharacterized protein YpmB